MQSILYSVGALYASLVIIKVVLSMPAVPLAAAILARRSGNFYVWMAVVACTLVISQVFLVIPSLLQERASFFVLYPKRTVARAVLGAMRDVRAPL